MCSTSSEGLLFGELLAVVAGEEAEGGEGQDREARGVVGEVMVEAWAMLLKGFGVTKTISTRALRARSAPAGSTTGAALPARIVSMRAPCAVAAMALATAAPRARCAASSRAATGFSSWTMTSTGKAGCAAAILPISAKHAAAAGRSAPRPSKTPRKATTTPRSSREGESVPIAESSLSRVSPAPGALVTGVAARRTAVSAARQPARARVASSIGAGPVGGFAPSPRPSWASTLVSAAVASSSCLGSGAGPAVCTGAAGRRALEQARGGAEQARLEGERFRGGGAGPLALRDRRAPRARSAARRGPRGP